jgi:hypothetical protein
MRGAALVLVLVSSPARAAEPLREDAPKEDAPKDDEAVDLSGAPEPAPAAEEEDTSWLDAPAERRCGFSVGLAAGGFLGSASGYPNDALKVDREEFLAETGFAGGPSGSLWVGVALADWVVIGLGGHGGRLFSADHVGTFGSIDLHVDVFPAFGAGGAWQDLGLLFEGGVGFLDVTSPDDTETTLIEASFGSRMSVGAFWEGIRAWKLSMGPFAAFDYVWSPNASRPAAFVGWRTALYAVP